MSFKDNGKYLSGGRFSLALLFVLLLFPVTLLAQREKKELTLNECVVYAREYSASALMARQTFLSAYWRYRSYQAEFLPSLRFEGTLPSFNRRLARYQLPDGNYKYIQENASTLSGALLLSQRIGWTGTRLFLRTSAERHDLFGERTSTDYMTTPVQVGLEHSFFGVNTLKWKRKVEPKRYEEAKRTYLQTLEQVTQEATNLFFNLLFAQQRLIAARLNRANADTLYRIAKGRYNIGTIAENDLLQMELDLLNETNSESEEEVNLQHAQFQLLTYLGLKSSYDLRPIPPAPYTGDTLSYPQMLELARQNNPTPLRLQIQNLDLGQYEDEEGRLINGARYLQQVLQEQRFEEAISFVEEQMKRLPLHQYDLLVDWLISYLRQLDFSVKEDQGFDEGYLQELERYLKEFKW